MWWLLTLITSNKTCVNTTTQTANVLVVSIRGKKKWGGNVRRGCDFKNVRFGFMMCAVLCVCVCVCVCCLACCVPLHNGPYVGAYSRPFLGPATPHPSAPTNKKIRLGRVATPPHGRGTLHAAPPMPFSLPCPSDLRLVNDLLHAAPPMPLALSSSFTRHR